MQKNRFAFVIPKSSFKPCLLKHWIHLSPETFLLDSSTPVVTKLVGSSNDPEFGGKPTEVSISDIFPTC
jgi:hypothetical protein